jgi:hypothetical protein
VAHLTHSPEVAGAKDTRTPDILFPCAGLVTLWVKSVNPLGIWLAVAERLWLRNLATWGRAKEAE